MIPLTSSPKRGYHALNGDLAKRKVLTSIKFLEKCAEFFTQKIKCSEEKALHAIIKAEEAKRIYHNIREMLGKDKWSGSRFTPQGHGFISHPVDQYVCTGKSQSLWDRVVG
jgi:hypothetical protein